MAAVQTRRLTLALACAAIALSVAGGAAQAGARRIVSLIPATTEMLFAMGAGGRLVGVGTFDHYPPAVDRLPRVGALVDPDLERILSLRPDLVIVYATQTTLRAQLDRAGIPYYVDTQNGLADITATMRTLGARVGLAAQADTAASRLERQLRAIRVRVAGLPRPRTLVVFGREPGSLRDIDASGGEGFLHDMLQMAGGSDALADIHRQSVMMSTEMVLARAPDVIIELRYTGSGNAPDSDLRVWNALASVPAVRNHRVYLLRGDEFVVPGPRVAQATERIARTLHPEAFR
jgi:iron complex transport system substrate-binding protein